MVEIPDLRRNGRAERTLGDLFSELSQEASTLIREEVQLAKVELRQTAKKAATDVSFLAAGGALAYAGLLVLLAALVLGLAEFMSAWLAALIVGVVVVIIAGALIMKGMNELKKLEPMPDRTIETLREDAEWLKEQVK